MFNKLRDKLNCVPNKRRTGYVLLTAGAIIIVSFLPGRAVGILTGTAIAVIGYCLIQS